MRLSNCAARTRLPLSRSALLLQRGEPGSHAAHERAEVTDAEAEGVQLRFLVAPQRVVTDESGRITGIECEAFQRGGADHQQIDIAQIGPMLPPGLNVANILFQHRAAGPLATRRAGSRLRFQATGRWDMGADKLPTRRQPSTGLDADCATLDQPPPDASNFLAVC